MGRVNLFSSLLPARAVELRLPETGAHAISHRFTPGGSALGVEPPDTLASEEVFRPERPLLDGRRILTRTVSL